MSTAGLDRAALAAHIDSGAIPGAVALVCRGEETHVESVGALAVGGPPMTRDSIFRMSSSGKPMAAAAAMTLVEEGVIGLDDPVDRFLPELADRRVLKRIDGPLNDTVPAHRPIRLRDLLTLRMGLGHIMARADHYPIRQALNELELLMGYPNPASFPMPDEWIKRVASVPLMYQPGERFLYDIGFDVLGVLIARAAGMSLDRFMKERLFDPLTMKDTGFHVPPEKIARFATSYMKNHETGALEVYDEAAGGSWSRPPAFHAAASGLVSTADDCCAFLRMMLNKGVYDGERILSPESVAMMTSDQLTDAQKADNDIFFGGHSGWGFGMAVVVKQNSPWTMPGRFGWDGGLGTSAHADPARDLVGVLLTQRAMDSPEPPAIFNSFWNAAYPAAH